MVNSRKIQTAVQCVGSFGEVVLFLAGYFLGTKAFVAAIVLILLRIVIKLAVSELMYRRQRAVIKEGFEEVQGI